MAVHPVDVPRVRGGRFPPPSVADTAAIRPPRQAARCPARASRYPNLARRPPSDSAQTKSPGRESCFDSQTGAIFQLIRRSYSVVKRSEWLNICISYRRSYSTGHAVSCRTSPCIEQPTDPPHNTDHHRRRLSFFRTYSIADHYANQDSMFLQFA